MSYTKTNWQNTPSTQTPISAANLNHMEQGIFDAAQTADSAQSGVDGLDPRMDLVEQRLDNLIPQGTPTQGNAELIDIRVGANGVTYPTAGDAVRGQVTQLKSALSDISETTRNLVVEKLNATLHSSGRIDSSSSYCLWVAPIVDTKEYTFKSNETSPFVGFFTSYPEIGDTAVSGRVQLSQTHTFTSAYTGYVVFRTSASFTEGQIVEGTEETEYIPHVTATDYTAREEIEKTNQDVESVNDEIDSIKDTVYDNLPIVLTFYRNSVAYDSEGNEYAVNVPVMENTGLSGEKGYLICRECNNLLSASDSISLSSAITVSIESGYYSLSVGSGVVTITINGDDTEVNDIYHFSVNSNTTVTITPDGTASFVQLEKNGQCSFVTPWQKGGIERKMSYLDADVSDISLSEFGVGFVFTPHDDVYDYVNHEMALLQLFDDTNNQLFVKINTSLNYITCQYTKAGTTYEYVRAPYSYNANVKKRVPLGIYVHVIPNHAVYVWVMRYGSATASVTYDNYPEFSSTLKNMYIGAYHGENRVNYSANGVFSHIVLSKKPNAIKYFEGVM